MTVFVSVIMPMRSMLMRVTVIVFMTVFLGLRVLMTMCCMPMIVTMLVIVVIV